MSEPSLTADARIDLHTHSSCSDGTETVAQLAASAAAAGLDAIALTDHDTTSGWAQAPAAARASDVAIIPGIEVSSAADRRSVHILALLVDPSPDTDLARAITRARESRETRAQRMVERLGADFPITWEDVTAQVAADDTAIGRPHIADALVALGIATDRTDAFTRILSTDSPYYLGYWAPSPVEAVEAIRAAGGVPILAHPGSSGRGRHREADGELVAGDAGLSRRAVDEMVDAGLVGIEVDHREHSPERRSALRDYAVSRSLLVTGGSDYHGAGKPNRLGENLTGSRTLEELISASTSDAEVVAP